MRTVFHGRCTVSIVRGTSIHADRKSEKGGRLAWDVKQMRKQQVEKWKERNDEKERTREKERGERGEGWGRGYWARSIGQLKNREERRRAGEGEGDYRRGIAAQEGEEINKGAKIERGEGMLGLGACLEALQLLSIRMRRLRIEVASCSVKNGPSTIPCGSIRWDSRSWQWNWRTMKRTQGLYGTIVQILSRIAPRK